MSFTYTGLDHVQLAAPVGSEDEARQFFTGLLGMPEIPKPTALQKNGGCWFQCGTQSIHIGVETPFAPAKKAHPAFLVTNLDALRARIIASGRALKDDTQIPTIKRFFISDPWGNRLEFMEILA